MLAGETRSNALFASKGYYVPDQWDVYWTTKKVPPPTPPNRHPHVPLSAEGCPESLSQSRHRSKGMKMFVYLVGTHCLGSSAQRYPSSLDTVAASALHALEQAPLKISRVSRVLSHTELLRHSKILPHPTPKTGLHNGVTLLVTRSRGSPVWGARWWCVITKTGLGV